MILKESERVYLRKMTLEDMEAVWAYRSLEKEQTKLYGSGDVLEQEELIEYILNSNPPRSNHFDWKVMAVVSKEDEQLIGDCRLSVGEGGASLYCTLSPPFRGRGLGKEVLMLAIDLLFDLPEVNQIGFAVDSRNVPAVRLMESVGMRFSPKELDHYAQGKSESKEVFYELTWQEWQDWKAKHTLFFPRENYESPECIRQWRWKYHHLGIPSGQSYEDAVYFPHLGYHVAGFRNNPFGVEWLRFEDFSPVHPLIKQMPHIAFEVDDIDTELRRRSFEVLAGPEYPLDRIKVSMIVFNGAPVELIQFIR